MGPQIDEIVIGGIVYIPKPPRPAGRQPEILRNVTLGRLLKSLENRLASADLGTGSFVDATYIPSSGLVILNLRGLGNRFWKIFQEAR